MTKITLTSNLSHSRSKIIKFHSSKGAITMKTTKLLIRVRIGII